MTDWREVEEDGKVWYVHEKFGNVLKKTDGVYMALMPKVIQLGPFETPEQAQQVLEQNQEAIDTLLDGFNSNIVSLMEQIKTN